MIVGNLTISKKGSVVEITLNTYHGGIPRAVFTTREIAGLIKELSAAAGPMPWAPPAPPIEDKSDELNLEDFV